MYKVLKSFPSKCLVFPFALIAVLLASIAPARADQSITLRSGNAPAQTSSNPAPQDAQVRFIRYAVSQDTPPTASDFSAVQTGAFAYINAPYYTYLHQLQEDPLAQWVGTTSGFGGGSALYAIPFTVTDPIVAAASLKLIYSVDNAIHGVYINGTEISNFVNDGDYHGEYYILRSDIAPLLIPNSVNWLYIKAYDYGGLAGLLFSANISTLGTAPGAPTISPTSGGNTGQVSVQLLGSGFEPPPSPGAAGPTLKLTGPGSPIPATSVNVASANLLTGTFDLTNATPGVWTVTVTNPDNTTIVLPNAFTVTQGGIASLQIQKIGNAAVAGYNETFFITITNTGTVDSGPVPIVEVLEPWFQYTSASPVPTSTQTSLNPISTDAKSPTYISSLEWDLPNIGAGATVNIAYTVLLNAQFPGGATVLGPACIDKVRQGCTSEVITCQNSVTQTLGPLPCLLSGLGCAGAIGRCYLTYVACAAIGEDMCSIAAYNARFAKDPNDISGPLGFGSQGWFNPKPPFQYILSYENDANATKSATNVYLSDAFDPKKFDLTTLTISGVIIGSNSQPGANVPLSKQPFGADIDLRPTQQLIVRVNAALDPVTNKVNVSLSSIDPETGLAPTDGTVGFLAPGADGNILISVQPKAPYPTGTVFQTAGSVIFDTNAAINTPTWTNTVDIDPPVSHVVALPATEASNRFNLSWTGTDLGSGIQNYTIYASDNGGPFTAWLTNTTGLSAVYPGLSGHTYAFYSIATDVAGNTEAPKSVADTSTKDEGPLATTLLSSSAPSVPLGTIVTFSAEVTPNSGSNPAPTGTISFYASGLLIGSAPLTGGTATVSTTALSAGVHTVTFTYSGDSVYGKQTSNALKQNISKLASAVQLASSGNSLPAGSNITFTATVTGANVTPSGTISFYSGSALLANVNLSSGSASFSDAALPAGTRTITAVYRGNADYLPATSAVFKQIVTKLTPTATVASSANPAPIAASVTFTASLGGSYTVPTGIVRFLSGGALLGQATLTSGVARFSTAIGEGGQHSITAQYMGDSVYTPLTSIPLKQNISKLVPTVTLTSSINPAPSGSPVLFTATVTGSDTKPGGSVNFYAGGSYIGKGALASGVATFTTSALTAPYHTVTAVYSGDEVYVQTTSNAIKQVINP